MAANGTTVSKPDGDDAFFSLETADLVTSLDEYEDDIVGWINNLLDGDEDEQVDLGHLDQRVSHLSTRLQIATQDTSTQLEQNIDDISRAVPRLTYDLQFMRESALTLQLGLKTIEAKTNTVAPDDPTSAALDRLHFLSSVKGRMEASREVLREAESWSALESEVSSLIASESYAKAGERLAEASKSMVVFQNTPEYESRRALMISLQNQLEASISSTLVAAITLRDVNACKSFFSIFGNIQRETEFRNYYYGSRRSDLVSSWQNASLLDCEGGGPTSPVEGVRQVRFAEFFRQFLDVFLSRIVEEQASVPAIFSDPQPTLSIFVQSTLDSLTPSLAQRLSGLVDHYGSRALAELVKVFRIAEEFAVSVDKVMEKVGYSAIFSQPSPAEDTSHTHHRRPSKRMSISRRYGSNKSISLSASSTLSGGGGTWEHALFEPFIDFQTEYLTLETKHVDSEISKVVTKPTSVGEDWSRVLQERSAAIFSLSDECLGRCIEFTHGYGAVGLVQVINHAFKVFLDNSRRDLIPQLRQPGQKTVAGSASPLDGESTFEELDYTPEDWSDFQLALHILETCRVIQERLYAFEGKAKSSLIQVSSAFRLAGSDPHGLYLSGTTRGEAELLLQSTLNSSELHTLLDLLDPTHAPNIPQHLPSPPLFSTAAVAITDFTRACQIFLQNIILTPLHAHLSTYAVSPVWKGVEAKANRGAFDLQIPSFSLSPSQTIQRVAEGLLNLPRLFEVYADDDALAFSVETLPFVDAAALESLMEPTPQYAVDEQPTTSRRLSMSLPIMRRASSATSVASIPRPPIPPPPTLSAEMVSSTWLNSLTLSLLAHLTSTILPTISTLSVSGAAQLGSDLAYLSNIIRALNVESEELEIWKELAEVADDEGKRRYIASRTEQRQSVVGNGNTTQSVQRILNTVAKMRGWTKS